MNMSENNSAKVEKKEKLILFDKIPIGDIFVQIHNRGWCMKKLLLILPMLFMFTVLSVGKASADNPAAFSIALYKDGSETTTYNINDVGSLYVYVPSITAGTFTYSFWNQNTPAGIITKQQEVTYPTTNYFWITLPSAFTSSDVGNWNVNAIYASSGTVQSADASFSVVTPEPGIMALYGIGGIPLALAFFRRRKGSAKV
ncbi:MAG: hypothetical protein V2A70_04860 [Candidatus Omnitrophota bacterium]